MRDSDNEKIDLILGQTREALEEAIDKPITPSLIHDLMGAFGTSVVHAHGLLRQRRIVVYTHETHPRETGR